MDLRLLCTLVVALCSVSTLGIPREFPDRRRSAERIEDGGDPTRHEVRLAMNSVHPTKVSVDRCVSEFDQAYGTSVCRYSFGSS